MTRDMSNGEMQDILHMLDNSWSKRMTDDEVTEWTTFMRSYTFDDAYDAIEQLRAEDQWRPSMARMNERITMLRSARAREAEMKALAAPKGQPEMTDTIRAVMDERRRIQNAARPASAHYHANGVEGCPLCKDHDHSDTRTFGFSVQSKTGEPDREGVRHKFEHKEPVPAWWFTCPVPVCGRPEYAREACNVWTPDGIAYLREHGMASTAVPRDPSGTEF